MSIIYGSSKTNQSKTPMKLLSMGHLSTMWCNIHPLILIFLKIRSIIIHVAGIIKTFASNEVKSVSNFNDISFQLDVYMYITFSKICFIKKFTGHNVVIVDFLCCVINRNENINI